MNELGETEKQEEILGHLVETVRNFSPEKILSSEKREQILATVTNGLDLMASTIKEQAVEAGGTWDEITPSMFWGLEDFARSALTPPLPPQAFEIEAEPAQEEEIGSMIDEVKALTEAIIADSQDWWEILSSEQKKSLWQILEEDFGIFFDDSRKKPVELIGHEGSCTGWVIKSEKEIIVPAAGDWPENRFKPALLFHPDHGLGLTCFVVS